MIEAIDLHKAFGKIRAVDGVSFRAEDGRITGLLGPNGAGKTTTLRMLYTLMRPDAGRVVVDGHDAYADTVAVRRRLGVLPDARGLYKRLTARENIAYFAGLHGVDEPTTRTSRAWRLRASSESRMPGAPVAITNFSALSSQAIIAATVSALMFSSVPWSSEDNGLTIGTRSLSSCFNRMLASMPMMSPTKP